MLKRPEAEGAYIEDEEELVKAVEGIELGECHDRLFVCRSEVWGVQMDARA